MQSKSSPSWNQIHHDLMSPLTVITGHTQLLQRQILRADGLTTRERDQLLDSVVSVLGAVQTLEGRIGALDPRSIPRSRTASLAEPSTPPRE